MEKDSRIYVAGHRGMVGSAICRKLESEGYDKLITRTSQQLDLREQTQVERFFEAEKPEFVFLAAAKVGGIMANQTYGADFLYENLAIQNNVIHQSFKHGVSKLLFLGSSCIYPRMAPQPLKEEYLLTGPLEASNEPYAIAKIAGIKMCQSYRSQYGCDFISVMPTNLYGPNDNYDLETSHVLAALIGKFHRAKQENQPTVEIWGTGSPKREFLHVDDLAQASVFLMNNYSDAGFINIGTGEDISIKDLAKLIGEIVGFDGDLKFDPTKPDGTPRKLLDVTRMEQQGWKYAIALREGIKRTYREYQAQQTLNS